MFVGRQFKFDGLFTLRYPLKWPCPLSLLKLVIKKWPPSAAPYISYFLPPPPALTILDLMLNPEEIDVSPKIKIERVHLSTKNLKRANTAPFDPRFDIWEEPGFQEQGLWQIFLNPQISGFLATCLYVCKMQIWSCIDVYSRHL